MSSNPATALRSAVPFGDLQRNVALFRAEYDEAIAMVLDRAWFVLGAVSEQFEQEFAEYSRAPWCVGCGSGTDAIQLALRAVGVREGDEVITVPNTCVPTAAGIRMTGASIRLCDVDPETALMCPLALDTELRRRPAKAVVPVHLYGQPVELDEIVAVARRHGAVVVEDAAQAHGSIYKGLPIGSHGTVTCWSFYPSKNLGAFGDGGAVTTHCEETAGRVRMLRNYGQKQRYLHSTFGLNSRLDDMQAAILRVRLRYLDEQNRRRRTIAEQYRMLITNPWVRPIRQRRGSAGCEHLFVVRTPYRDRLLDILAGQAIECRIHYPIPVHLQPAFPNLNSQRGRYPVAEELCAQVLSLPIYPELTDAEVRRVIHAVNSALESPESSPHGA